MRRNSCYFTAICFHEKSIKHCVTVSNHHQINSIEQARCHQWKRRQATNWLLLERKSNEKPETWDRYSLIFNRSNNGRNGKQTAAMRWLKVSLVRCIAYNVPPCHERKDAIGSISDSHYVLLTQPLTIEKSTCITACNILLFLLRYGIMHREPVRNGHHRSGFTTIFGFSTCSGKIWRRSVHSGINDRWIPITCSCNNTRHGTKYFVASMIHDDSIRFIGWASSWS